jgi:hypothetical protein
MFDGVVSLFREHVVFRCKKKRHGAQPRHVLRDRVK